ncbi:DNA repair protein RAD51 homolog 4-like, partial [Saccoglossus kowalevskii]|uniref:DNA repair protein RAD51 homolog 4-like n=1 Tax=Saccoglossus kowalevskii TaxID=10224 RepID=A0ABM0M491_SACKO
FCLTVSANVAVVTKQNVFYIDTSGSFSAERLQDIMMARQGDEQSVKAAFNRIHCCNAFDVYQVIQTLEEIRSSIIAGNNSFYTSMKLLVLDSIAAVISPILGGQQTD